MNEDEIKSKAIMEFIDLMIGALNSGFVDQNFASLSELHRIAENHIYDSYNINIGTIKERHGEDLAKRCGLGQVNNGT